jgi:hypothetical protein
VTSWKRALSTIAVTLLGAGEARAAPDDVGDDHYLAVHSETRADLFRRAALPGPNGAIIGTETALPIRQSVSLSARDLDTPVGTDSTDFELSAWGLVAGAPDGLGPSPDGDIQTAFVRLHRGPASLRLGRQVVTGGAARYARFDGVTVDAALGMGFEASAYGGLTALPRWSARPAYYNLGSSSDVALRNPAALPPSGRSGYVLAGARAGWSNENVGATLSFHEQRDFGELSHRSLGADVRAQASERVSVFGDAILEVDARRFSDARLWVDASPARPLDVSLEYRHTEPALLLARTSVLSVFSTGAFDETGAEGLLKASRDISLDASGFVQLYDGGRPGARSEVALKVVADKNRRTFVRLSHARLLAPDNGYHSVRASLSQRLMPSVTGTLEAYFYLYDHPVLRYRTSSVFAGTLGFRPSRALGVLLASSIAQTPYARLDAQTSLQVTCDFDVSGIRRTR